MVTEDGHFLIGAVVFGLLLVHRAGLALPLGLVQQPVEGDGGVIGAEHLSYLWGVGERGKRGVVRRFKKKGIREKIRGWRGAGECKRSEGGRRAGRKGRGIGSRVHRKRVQAGSKSFVHGFKPQKSRKKAMRKP